ncbi:hypothetical protein PTSG_09898 [Salpingoeca rosetta]|uniref:Sulfotransferase domain-containing protein n=1 Tax=Salpingoeca rosetta (strain ATCC 50818 / BSB-021) TaxID=946362 RepID=F2UNG2_SALR5|nr:uncharacterized protein PTSG_09898 [Salpingoeca rosetta]EGD79167.1 hypothetical protein PTSG_09898 [Salpingoeca rosetta]|eukprot:XP_004989252.1 hypothetical protein PTSG_09898 [Salpingoeca rosetta]
MWSATATTRTRASGDGGPARLLLVGVVMVVGAISLSASGVGVAAGKPKTPAEICAPMTTHPERVNQTQRALRPFWLHVPKCGTTFSVTMGQVHCPEARITEPVISTNKILKTPACKNRFARLTDPHDGLVLSETKRMVVMLRDPLDRVISGYLHKFHDCKSMQLKYCGAAYWDRCNTPPPQVLNSNPDTVLQYAKCVQGLATHMLNGHHSRDRNFQAPTPHEVLAAAKRLQEAAFVGIQEEWNKSVCLYRAMFGEGGMTDVSFGVARPSKYPENKNKVRKLLKDADWFDTADNLVYHAALERFKNDSLHFLGE